MKTVNVVDFHRPDETPFTDNKSQLNYSIGTGFSISEITIAIYRYKHMPITEPIAPEPVDFSIRFLLKTARVYRAISEVLQHVATDGTRHFAVEYVTDSGQQGVSGKRLVDERNSEIVQFMIRKDFGRVA